MKVEAAPPPAEVAGELTTAPAEARPASTLATDLQHLKNGNLLRPSHDTNGQAIGAPPPRDIYQDMLKALRGRYRLTVVLALVGAGLGAITAFYVKVPLYKSEGL